MSQIHERIEQFRKMFADHPDDEIGHFRLGQLFVEAEDHPEAIKSFERTIELAPTFSKAYQLLGASLIKVDQKEKAIDVLTRGWKIADERGDRIPKQAMADLLRELNAPVPEPARPAPEGPETNFRCHRPGCMAGNYARELPRPPIPDAIGERIQKEICHECWMSWLKDYSIKVVNELRIDLSTEFGQEEYDKYMRGYFGFEETTPGSIN